MHQPVPHPFHVSRVIAPAVDGIVEALSDRPGWSEAQKQIIREDATTLILAFQPRDAFDAMLVGQAVLFNELFADGVRELFQATDEGKPRSFASVISLGRLLQGQFDRLMKRDIQPYREDIAAGPATAVDRETPASSGPPAAPRIAPDLPGAALPAAKAADAAVRESAFGGPIPATPVSPAAPGPASATLVSPAAAKPASATSVAPAAAQPASATPVSVPPVAAQPDSTTPVSVPPPAARPDSPPSPEPNAPRPNPIHAEPAAPRPLASQTATPDPIDPRWTGPVPNFHDQNIEPTDDDEGGVPGHDATPPPELLDLFRKLQAMTPLSVAEAVAHARESTPAPAQSEHPAET